MTGLSGALNVVLRLSGALPGPSSMVGKPRSPSAGPPSDMYLSRIAPVMTWAPVAGVKKILPPGKFWPKPSPAGYTPPSLGPRGPVSPPAACHAAVIAASASSWGVADALGAASTSAAADSNPTASRLHRVRRALRCPFINPPAIDRDFIGDYRVRQLCVSRRRLPRNIADVGGENTRRAADGRGLASAKRPCCTHGMGR